MKQNLARANRIWPTAVAGKTDMEQTLSTSACRIDGPNSVKPGQILFAYVISNQKKFHEEFREPLLDVATLVPEIHIST